MNFIQVYYTKNGILRFFGRDGDFGGFSLCAQSLLEGAKKLYLKLCRIETPEPLPEITDTVGKPRKIRLSGKAG